MLKRFVGNKILHVGDPQFTFTTNANYQCSPTFVAATLSDSDFNWVRLSNGAKFTGKAPSSANFPTGSYAVSCTNWAAVTQMNWSNDKLSAIKDPFSRVLPKMTSLTTLNISSNASITSSMTYLQFPASLQTINFDGNSSMIIDFSEWTLPAALTSLSIQGCSNAGGNISGLVMPANVTTFYLSNDVNVSYDSSSGLFSSVPNGIDIIVYGCGLSQTEVDRVFADLVASAAINGILNIAGNTAPSSYDDRNTLVARGWTVTVD